MPKPTWTSPPPIMVSMYLFAWRYFVPIYKNNRVYHPNRREGDKWPDPELSDFAETANDYNSQRFQPGAPLQVAIGSAAAPATIQEWMNICLEASFWICCPVYVGDKPDFHT